jgi:hypothetical protein
MNAAVLVVALSLSANNFGIFGKSGRDADNGTCTQCHVGQGTTGPAPTLTVTGLDKALHAGGFADVVITIKTKDPSNGIAAANCPNRCAGFGAAVDTGAGAFVIPTADPKFQPIQVNAKRDEIAHIAKSQFVDGAVSYHAILTGLTQGNHTLFLAGNDVNGQDATGDRVATIKLPFTVGAATSTSPTNDQPPGCSSTSASATGPVFATLALMGAVSLARSRRRCR